MNARLAWLMIFGLVNAAFAQDSPDLLGSWAFTVKGRQADPRCGERIETGVLDIERKITPRAYRGKVRTVESSKRCPGSETNRSGATIRVKDDVVTVEYDEDGWAKDRLLLKGNIMEGSRGDGITTRWERAAQSTGDAPTAQQLADLENFLTRIEPELKASLEEQFFDNLEKNLARTGLTGEEASQVAGQTIERMTECMLEELRISVLARKLPIAQVLAQQNLSVVFNPQAMDVQTKQCVEDTSSNAGVRIR
jgi:hypothetical protein